MKRRSLLVVLVLVVAAGSWASAQEVERARAVVVGGDGRLLELHSEKGTSTRFGPDVTTDGAGNVVVLETLGLGRGFLGVQLIGLTDQLRERFGVPAGEGALVSEVVPGSPAEKAGVEAGDVITAVGLETVRRTGDVRRLVAERDGELVDLELFRDEAPMRLTATVVERQRPLLKVRRAGEKVVLEWIGGGQPSELDAERGRFFFDDALEGLELYFESDEWRDRANGTEDELDTVTLELRIDTVKKQLDELRDQLESLEADDREPGSGS